MLSGSCLCRGVRYEIDGPLLEMGHCHCSMCRKASGAAFGTYARVSWKSFRFVSGEDRVQSYASSPGVTRTFCDRCGSTLQWIREGRDNFGLAAGTLDADPGVKPSYQIWTGSKVPWWELDPDLLSHETAPG